MALKKYILMYVKVMVKNKKAHLNCLAAGWHDHDFMKDVNLKHRFVLLSPERQKKLALS